MSRTFQLSFANLTCRFGDQLTLLDLANEVVLPAFFDPRNVRKHGLNRFIFRNVGLTLASADGVDGDQLVVYGRLINNTTLVRNQTYTEEEGLKADDATLSSAPSSFFALNLSDHKLMYMPETAYAPSLISLLRYFSHLPELRRTGLYARYMKARREVGNHARLLLCTLNFQRQM